MFSNFFQIGGSLPSESPSYVKRRADEDLFYFLKNSQFCYVLTARQMGKSSLRVQTMKRLHEHGFLCSAIDLTAIGAKNITPEQWYYSLTDRIAYDLGVYDFFEQWWVEHEKLTPSRKFGDFLEHIILEKLAQPIVIFIDEIDTVLSLNSPDFNTDDFFAAIRSFYNARSDNEDFKRLNFTLLGVASPDELVRDPARTPFNIGIPIALENFQFEESREVLTRGFSDVTNEPDKLLKAIFEYTNGHPYLTQKTCANITQRGYIHNIEEVTKQTIQQLFFSGEGGELDANLANIQNRISAETRYGAEMLQIYQELLNRNSIILKRSDPSQIYLRLSGLVSESKGFLKIDNKIYEHFFNRKWAVEMLKKMDRPYTVDLERWVSAGKKDPSTANIGSILRDILEWSKTTTLTELEKEYIIFCQEIDRQDREDKYKIAEQERTERRLIEEKKTTKQLKRRNIWLRVAIFALVVAAGVIFYIQQRFISANTLLKQTIAELTNKETEYDQLIEQIDDVGDEKKAKEDSVLNLQLKLRELQEKYGEIINRVEAEDNSTTSQDEENKKLLSEINTYKKMISVLRGDTIQLRNQIRELTKKTELADKPISEQRCRGANLAFLQLEYGEGNMYDQGTYKTITNRVSKAIGRHLQESNRFPALQMNKDKDYRERTVSLNIILNTIEEQGYEGYITGNILERDASNFVIRIDVHLFSQTKPCTSFIIPNIPKDIMFSQTKIEQLRTKLKEGILNGGGINQMRFRIEN